ncbi:hypothetical protein AB0M02_29785 [Actinoplanes sp. NPDC051861]|uniref:hypothetical protein n=1 Tax=Actinoplanes sp. NPDC051861 TaxID=3155170 RepID=UPI00341854B4
MTSTWAARWFLVLAALYVFGGDVLPFGATLTSAALLAYALAGDAPATGAGRLLTGGLATGTAAAAIWDTAPNGAEGHALAAEFLATAAAALLATSVLIRARRPRIAMLPAALFAVAVLVLAGNLMLDMPSDPWIIAPDPLDRAIALSLPALALILLGFAINAGLLTRPLRLAATALAPVLLAAAGLLFLVEENDLVSSRWVTNPGEGANQVILVQVAAAPAPPATPRPVDPAPALSLTVLLLGLATLTAQTLPGPTSRHLL